MRARVFGTQIQCRSWSVLTILVAFCLNAHADLERCKGSFKTARLSKDQLLKTWGKEKAYTEGLAFSDGLLYESVGLVGHSQLRSFNPKYASTKVVRDLPNYFAEGIAVYKGHIYQITQNQNSVIEHIPNGPYAIIQPPTGVNGWGLAELDGQLVKSDGTSKLQFLDPETFDTNKTITVHTNDTVYDQINALSSAHGYILANIYYYDWIALINPKSGCVEKAIDLSALRTADTKDASGAVCPPASTPCDPAKQPGDFVANGIAFDSTNDELYITGKNWPYIYVVKFPLF